MTATPIRGEADGQAIATTARQPTAMSLTRGNTMPGIVVSAVTITCAITTPPTAPAAARSAPSINEARASRQVAGAKRGPHGNFARAGEGAGEQQVGEVDGGDEQDQRHEAGDQKQRGPHRTDDVCLQRLQRERAAAIGVGIFRGKPIAHGRGDALRLFDRDAGTAAARWRETRGTRGCRPRNVAA